MEKRLRPLAGLAEGDLLIHEIYASIQGESTYAGLPCTFVRTTACNLRCTWCDTPHAFGQGQPMAALDVLEQVKALSPKLVEFTGGEPLLQPALLPLMTQLLDDGYGVLLETGGSLDIGVVDERVVKIVDFKAPASGEVQANLWENIPKLQRHDEVKFVLADRDDYLWARKIIQQYNLSSRCHVLMSVVFGMLEPQELVAWLLEDQLQVRMQLQMHKYIWHANERGV